MAAGVGARRHRAARSPALRRQGTAGGDARVRCGALAALVLCGALAAQQAQQPKSIDGEQKILREWLAGPASAPLPWSDGDKGLYRLHEACIERLHAFHGSHAPTGPDEVHRLEAVILDLHVALARVPQCAETFAAWETWYLVQLSLEGRFEAGLHFVEGVALRDFPDSPGRARLLAQKSQMCRRLFRWRDALAAVDEAAAQPDMNKTARWEVLLNRATLALEMGQAEIAAALAREVQALEPGDVATESAADLAQLWLRIDRMLGNPDRAVERLAALLSLPVPPDLAKAWPGRVADLRIRTAMAVLDDPRRRGPATDQAVAWLRDVQATPGSSLDRRLLAHTVLGNHCIDAGDWAGADAALADLPEEANRAERPLDDRVLTRVGLRVRLALERGAADAELAATMAPLAAAFDSLLASWSDAPAGREGFGFLFFDDRRLALAELVRARRRLEGSEAALADVLRAQACGSLARALGATSSDLAAIRAALAGADSGLLIHVPGRTSTTVFAVDAGSVVVGEVGVGARELDELRNDLTGAILRRSESGARADLDRARQRLAEALLPPSVAERVRAWRVVGVTGADVLGYVPFELLQLTDGQPLGCSHAVRYLPSASVGLWLSANTRPLPARSDVAVHVVACPDAPVPARLATAITPLPFTAADRDSFAAALSGTDLRLHTGGDAIQDRFDAAGLSGAVLLQVLAHGVRDENRLDPQGLLLGDGSILWPAGIERLHLPPVVLYTACRAGRGRIRCGDDGRHLLAGASLLAGARAVVVPSVDVDYRATVAFSLALHENLWREPVSLSEALRLARVSHHRRAPDDLEPFLFHLIGIGDFDARGRTPAPTNAAVGAAAEASGAGWPTVIAVGLGAAAAAVLGWSLLRRRRAGPSAA